MSKRTHLMELIAASVALILDLAMMMGWIGDIGPVMPLWIRIIVPCLLLFPMKPREPAYWLDRLPWAVAIGLFLHRSALPGELRMVRMILWFYLAVRAALALWNRKHAGAHA